MDAITIGNGSCAPALQGIRLLSVSEIELVSGGDWSFAEMLLTTAGGAVSGAAGAAA